MPFIKTIIVHQYITINDINKQDTYYVESNS